MSFTVRKSDFNKICRTCLMVKKDMFSIHLLEVPKMLLTCTGVKIEEDDELPHLICAECIELIQKSFKFKELCLQSENTLIKVLQGDISSRTIRLRSDKSRNNDLKDEIEIKHESSGLDDFTSDILQSHNDNVDYASKCNLINSVEEKRHDICSDEFTNDTLQSHNDLEDSDNESNCNLNNSESSSHEARRSKRIKIEENEDSDDDSDLKLISCKICSKKIRESTLQGHMRRHRQPRKHTCDKCTKAYREPNELAKHRIRVHQIKESVTCEVCEEVFQIQAQLDFHMKRHFKKKSVCDICGKVYFNSAKLKRHKQVHENRDKTIFCLQCDRMFARESSLIVHNRNYHSGKPLVKKICNICGKSVLNIKTHTLQRHSTERPFQCDKCNKAFAIKYQLFKHVKEKHEETQKIYNALCSTCGKCYKSVTDLKVHMLSHTDIHSFACHMCDKKYKSPQGLKCHIRKHADLRPFICTYCSKGFYTSQILKNHLRTHTGERPYVCKLCGRAFTQNCALKAHMKVHGLLQIAAPALQNNITISPKDAIIQS